MQVCQNLVNIIIDLELTLVEVAKEVVHLLIGIRKRMIYYLPNKDF